MADGVQTPTKVEKYFNALGMIAIHGGAIAALFMPFRKRDVIIAIALYWIRMFVITAGYHRYFSHKSYKTSRVFQFLLAVVGTTCTQKGPLWWAATHRRHHRESDTPRDVHSPVQRGFWYSHIGWIFSPEHESYDPADVKDLYKYPELRWLDRWHVVPVLGLIAIAAIFGGWTGVAWWYAMSTMFLFHCTFTINSLAHVWGKRRFATTDDSRNNAVLAIITMGEGWHNNHHRYMQTANQGFYWWQIDASYYVLRTLAFFGLVWELKKPPQRILEEGRQGNPAPFERIRESIANLELPQPADAE